VGDYVAYLVRTFSGHKPYLKVVLGLFVLGIVIGILEHEAASGCIKDAVSTLFGKFENLRGFTLFIRIFLNNLAAAAMATASGIVFGILPLLSAFLNGLVIGTVLTQLVQLTEITALQAILSLVPHGMFEIPAFLLSLALGLALGTWPFRQEKSAFLAGAIKNTIAVYARIVIPLLIVAAAIETIGIELLRRAGG
jgi:stage II sporulation protein M